MRRFGAILLVAALCLAAPAYSATILFTGLFTPEGGPGATGSGTASVLVDTTLRTLDIQATWSGTSGTSTVAHIHCCTLSPGAGNAGVATTTPTFVGFPAGVTGGSYSKVLDMNLAGSWNPAYITANGGTTTTAFNALLSGMLNDRSYFNIHTNLFPGGEIRARLIPEPGTMALLGLGLVVLAARRR